MKFTTAVAFLVAFALGAVAFSGCAPKQKAAAFKPMAAPSAAKR